MKRSILVLASLALILGGVGQARAVPLVVNGSFEQVQIGSPYVSNNLSDVPGWTHTGSLGDGPLWHVGYADGDGSVTVAGQGKQFVTMGGGFGTFGTSTWSQLVSGFTVGQTYTLTFDMAAEANYSGPQMLTAGFTSGSSTGSQTFTAATPPTNYWSDWETKSMNFVATSTSVGLQFSAATYYDVGLDDVRISSPLSASPEPSSLALLGTTSASLAGYFGWRRRKTAVA